MAILNDPHARITAVILLAGDFLYLAYFPITVLYRVLHTMLSLIAVVLLPALVGAVATLHYDATSGCPGDPLSFTCLAFGTDVLKWNMNSQQIGFRSSSNVADQHSPQTIDGYYIVANLTSKSCRSEGDCSFGSQLHIVIPDMGDLTLSCQSNNSDSETIIVTVNGGYNTYMHVCIQCTILHNY